MLARDPGTWQGPYNAACFQALAGDDDAAFEQLRVAFERAPAMIAECAPGDGDLSVCNPPALAGVFG